MKNLNLKLKNFIKIFVCLILCLFAFCLSACGKGSNDNYVYPTSSAETSGNGGLTVRKGDYIYFVGISTFDFCYPFTLKSDERCKRFQYRRLTNRFTANKAGHCLALFAF